ncbi:MAG: glycosyltransferase family 4 protein [Verrucomicrobiota bacterium]
MRILVHDYAGHPFQVQLSRELARMGHTVKHAYASALQTPRGELTVRPDDPEGFSVEEVPMHPKYKEWKYSFVKRQHLEIGYGRKLARLVRRWKPDAVLSSNTPTEPQASLLEATKNVGARFVYWVQDFYSIAVDKIVRKKLPVVGPLVGSYYKTLDRQQFRASDHIVPITEDFSPLLENAFGVMSDRITPIPNWAPLESLPQRPKDNPWSREHNLHDKFVYLYTGTLGMKHNPGLLLSLAEEMEADDDVAVVVVSEGIGAEFLKEKKESLGLENLILLPYQPFDQLPNVLGTGDVLTCILEPDAGIFSVPSKVLSYLCAGRPLLLAVPPENLAARIIREEDAGLTVGPQDTEGFLDAAISLLNSPKTCEHFSNNSRNYAEFTFDIEKIGLKFTEIIES